MPNRDERPRERFFLRPWVLGLLFAALLFTVLFLFFKPQYVTNDDAVILRAFMGYEGGEPASFHLYTHTAFAWLLYALAVWFPGIAWFSILQLSLLFLSCAVVIKSFAQLLRRGLQTPASALLGALLGLFLTASWALFFIVRITYSMTAAFLGAAAVAHLFSVETDRGKGVIPRMLGGAALLLCNYFLRQITVLPALCFYALAAGMKLLWGGRAREARRAVLLGLLYTALLFLLFAGIREADIALQNGREYIRWQDARIRVLDYTDYTHHTRPETLSAIGWSPTLLQMTSEWFFLDDRVTADAFHAIAAQVTADTQQTPGERLTAAWASCVWLFTQFPRLSFAGLSALCLALLGVAAAPQGKRRWAALNACLALFGGAAMLLGFAWLGRFSDRVALTALLPMNAALAAGALASIRPWRELKQRKAFTAAAALLIAAALCLGGAAGYASAVDAVRKDHAQLGADIPEVDIDEYALLYPDLLFIYDYSMPSNETVFPDTAFGVPANVMSWGGWAIHSPSWRRMVQEFGIYELNASIFLRDNVVYATRYDQPPQLLLDYLQENTASPVEWEFFDTYGVIYFYTFHTV